MPAFLKSLDNGFISDTNHLDKVNARSNAAYLCRLAGYRWEQELNQMYHFLMLLPAFR